jgi:hypothetical protein
VLGLPKKICTSTNELNVAALAHHLDGIRQSIEKTDSPSDVFVVVVVRCCVSRSAAYCNKNKRGRAQKAKSQKIGKINYISGF